MAAAECLTLPDYTADQTRAEVAKMIEGGRVKWNTPNPEHVVEKNETPSDFAPTPGWTFDFAKIKRRKWLLGDRLIREFVTLTAAPGGLNKTILTIEEAIAVATGRPITGAEVHERGAAWVFNNEDPIDELQRRVAAICIRFDIDKTELTDRFYINSGLTDRLVVAQTIRNATVQTPAVDALVSHIQVHDIKLFTVDPFVRWHDVEERDNSGIDFVVRQFATIAQRCGCAISLVHHTRKAPAGTSYAGDADAARGASALVYACRAAFTLAEMTPTEAQDMGIGEDRRRWYVRLDAAKGNLSPPAESATWFERASVELPNGGLNIGDGDHVGVLMPWDAPSGDFILTPDKATEILQEVDERWSGGDPFGDSHQSGERWLVNHMVDAHGIPRRHAKKVLADWLANQMVRREQVDSKRKKFGLRVPNWRGFTN